jgi:bifunctional N-acetylglutamate synthase/kinase
VQAAADVVLRFLEGVGRRSEAEFYLALFRAEAKERFAAIYVDANVARHALDAVVLELSFLASLGLSPVVVLGLVEPTDAVEHASRLRRRLERNEVAAKVVLEVEPEHRAAATATTCRGGVIPIVPFLVLDGESTDARFAALGQLLTALGTRKLIVLHRPGGLHVRGQLVPIVSLGTDDAALATSKDLSRKQQVFLAQARRLVLELVPHKLLVAIASPLDLLRELFTVRGAGTLLRRGSVIEAHTSYASLDRERLRALVESSFGRPPLPALFEREVAVVYLEEQYRGAAILESTALGAYLSKFAVEREAQGEGLGRDLWQRMEQAHPTVFWRARADNPVNTWYDREADGLARLGTWHVYWKGLAPERIPDAIAFALAAPVDF